MRVHAHLLGMGGRNPARSSQSCQQSQRPWDCVRDSIPAGKCGGGPGSRGTPAFDPGRLPPGRLPDRCGRGVETAARKPPVKNDTPSHRTCAGAGRSSARATGRAGRSCLVFWLQHPSGKIGHDSFCHLAERSLAVCSHGGTSVTLPRRKGPVAGTPAVPSRSAGVSVLPPWRVGAGLTEARPVPPTGAGPFWRQ
jgi:hypothetical protein